VYAFRVFEANFVSEMERIRIVSKEE